MVQLPRKSTMSRSVNIARAGQESWRGFCRGVLNAAKEAADNLWNAKKAGSALASLTGSIVHVWPLECQRAAAGAAPARFLLPNEAAALPRATSAGTRCTHGLVHSLQQTSPGNGSLQG
ncbi:hypothetical protein NDU88_007223 [Pleurodeles waltl]|uniref:Uncharacterized protein n=1 Tax=Pleurodeles waltl TaxID=8319 RepID=A0AAV7RPN0_PLEWA|nr:hypothetical protein NDU88_007223 [Pleurodeles waltl]